ncbi:MAG: MFS transporter, partial [Acidimicrobiales bacterium]
LGVLGVVLLVAFAFIERRAKEPLLPLHLFRNRTFSVASAVGFIIGFAMFGALTFLPLFFQVVKGLNPTNSGLQLVPLMAGLLLLSIGSGQIIARTGRYRVFPLLGTGLISLGLFLFSLLNAHTATWEQIVFMVILGAGLGSVMQVLVLITQNSVAYSELGVATSGATFFRSIGGSFGAAIFGAIFSNVLAGKLITDLRGVKLPSGLSGASITPAALHQLPEAARHAFVAAYGSSTQVVFLAAVPVGVLAFVITWFLPNVELRRGGPAAKAAGSPAVEATAASPALDPGRTEPEAVR